MFNWFLRIKRNLLQQSSKLLSVAAAWTDWFLLLVQVWACSKLMISFIFGWYLHMSLHDCQMLSLNTLCKCPVLYLLHGPKTKNWDVCPDVLVQHVKWLLMVSLLLFFCCLLAKIDVWEMCVGLVTKFWVIV